MASQDAGGAVTTQHWRSAPEPRLATLSGIASYRVLSVHALPNKFWQADVEAKVLKARALRPERSALFSIVVLPFTTNAAGYELRTAVSGATVARRLQEAIEESLAQSGQVRLLDRSHTAALAAELAIAGASTDPQQGAKLGRTLGADLLLTGRIERFELGQRGVGYYGDSNTTLDLHMRVHYRLIDVATGDVLLADTLDYNPPAARLANALRAAGISTLDTPNRLGDAIYPDAARALANPVLNAVFPLQVLKVSGADSIFVSQGQGRMAVGDTLAVVTTQTLRDPQSGAPIAVHQLTDVRLAVTQVNDGYAVTKPVLGKLASVHAGNAVILAPVVADSSALVYPLTPGSSEAPVKWE